MKLGLGIWAALTGLMTWATVATAANHEGLDHLINKSYATPFLTDRIFENLPRSWSETDRRAHDQAPTADAKIRAIWDYYGFVRQPGRPADSAVPMGWIRDDQGSWSLTCFACHGGTVNGVPTFGVGNNRLDIVGLSDDINEIRHLLKKEDGYDPQGMFPAGPPSAPPNLFKGNSNSFYDTLFLFSLRDPEMNFLPAPQNIGAYRAIPVDVPPFWNVHKKKKIYMKGSGGITPRTIMQFMLGTLYPAEVIQAAEPDFVDILEWIKSQRVGDVAGTFPGPANRKEEGQKVFRAKCAGCHGTYGQDGNYPGILVSIGTIGTDKALMTEMTPEFLELSRKSWFNYSGQGQGLYSNAQGYVPPPLDGVWATAPYLHNGSVPTIRALLGDPTARPTVWKVTDYDHIDTQNLGLPHEPRKDVPQGLNAHERRKYYDTTQYGAGNGGHDIAKMTGRALTPEQLEAVLDYLKTL